MMPIEGNANIEPRLPLKPALDDDFICRAIVTAVGRVRVFAWLASVLSAILAARASVIDETVKGKDSIAHACIR